MKHLIYILTRFIIKFFPTLKYYDCLPLTNRSYLLTLVMPFTHSSGLCCQEESLNHSRRSLSDMPHQTFTSNDNCCDQERCFKEQIVLSPPLEILQNNFILIKWYFQVFLIFHYNTSARSPTTLQK